MSELGQLIGRKHIFKQKNKGFKMQKIIRVVLIFFGIGLSVNAEDLTIAENGKSNYRIVVAQNANKNVRKFYIMAAELLHKCLKESTGASLPVILDKYDGNAPTIFIGKCPAAKKSGININSLKGWTYSMKNDGKNIFLLGHDAPRFASEKSHHYNRYYLGSVKAVVEFAKRYCGTRFVLPGSNGTAVKKQAKIVIPANLAIQKTPSFIYCSGRGKGIFYDIANNFFPALCYGTYGGHSHDKAISVKKYRKSHPEYFALIRGKRNSHLVRPQHCLSNPQVQELIYQELLSHVDKGYEWVQLGQSDGFLACECKNCRNMYGIKSKYVGYKGRKDPTWGEKLWIMHIKMAKRFAKDRPGKKLVILAYGPTKNPPNSIKQFPDNIIIELCKYSPEDFAQWGKVKVTGGFTTYIYNWGFYQIEGFTPKQTPEFCKKQLKLFKNNNVKGIYRCGFGELLGLEGPVYYVYGKLLENVDADPQKLSDEYCNATFGKAYKAMKTFYSLLHKRIGMKLDSKEADWNDSDLLSGAKDLKHKNMKLLLLRYPNKTVSKLDKYLAQAEKDATDKKVKIRLKLVRTEFDYLKCTASLTELFISYTRKPSLTILRELNQAIKKRNSFIASLKIYKNGRIANSNGFTIFSNAKVKTLSAGGRLQAPLKGPFLWDFDFYLKHGIVPNNRVIKAPKSNKSIILDGKADDPVWEKAKAQYLVRIYMNKNTPMIYSTVKVAYDKDAFYVLGTYDQVDSKKLKLDRTSVFLGTRRNKTNSFMFSARLSSKHPTRYKCTPGAGPGNTDIYKGIEASKGHICISGNSKTGAYTVEVRIPFKRFGKTPSKGDIWFGNFKRVCAKGEFIWEPNIFLKTWRDRHQTMGKIIFE